MGHLCATAQVSTPRMRGSIFIAGLDSRSPLTTRGDRFRGNDMQYLASLSGVPE